MYLKTQGSTQCALPYLMANVVAVISPQSGAFWLTKNCTSNSIEDFVASVYVATENRTRSLDAKSD